MEESLCQAQQELELRVLERTDELAQANACLQAEIEERTLAQTELQLTKFCIDRATDAIACIDRGGNGELILVVDDETIVQQTVQETLVDYNYKTLVANDGIEAIALYVEYQPEISAVLLDMLMPNMDGLTAIRTLGTINPNVKIIGTSGLPANEQKAIAAGADKFLSKPYTTTDLLTTLSDVIGIKE